MKKIIIFFVFTCAILTPNICDCFGQSITWQKTYGSLNLNEGFSIVQTPDGGYLAVGRDRAGQDEKAWLLRLNQFGDTVWTKFVMNDMPIKIIQTNDNNYVILGAFTTIVKVDIDGNQIWLSGPYDNDKTFISIVELNDGSFAICGRKSSGAISHPYFIKINQGGDSLMEKNFTNNIFHGQFSDLKVDDNSIILCGTMSDSAFITNKLFVMKADNFGNQIWLNRVDSLRTHGCRSVFLTENSEIIVSGIRYSINKPFAAKFDSNGVIIWYKIFNMPNMAIGYFTSGLLAEDGNYTFTGTWDSTGNLDIHILLLRTDTSGSELWHNSFGFNNSDLGNEVKQTTDSGYIIIGTREGFQGGDVYIIKTDKHGYANPPIGIQTISGIVPDIFNFYPLYPNPSNPEFTVKFDISSKSFVKIILYDLLGRQVAIILDTELNQGSYKMNNRSNHLPSGIYFVRLTAQQIDINSKIIHNMSQKLILIK